MSKQGLEKIVASLELCRKIPAGEFEDTALVWVYDDVVGFLCRTSGCEQFRKKVWQLQKNHPRKIAIRRKCGQEIYPAPTLEEIITSLLTYGWLVKIDCRIQLDTLIEFYSDVVFNWIRLLNFTQKNKAKRNLETPHRRLRSGCGSK